MTMHHPENEEKVAIMFDRIAPKYDFLNRLLSLRQDQRWRKVLVSLLPKRSQGSLIDVATGTGDVLIQAMETRGDYKNFTGVDISTEMLALAKEKIKKLGQNRTRKVVIAKMSAESLESIPDQSVDALTISFGLRNVVDKERALKEFARVIAPGGRVLILEFFLPDGPGIFNSKVFAQTFEFYFHNILPKIGAIFSDKEAYSYLPKSVSSFYNETELTNILEQVGFVKGPKKHFLFGACRIITGDKPIAIELH